MESEETDVARQQLGKHIPAVNKYMHNSRRNLVHSVFHASVSYQILKKVGY
jgi:hypothetical protein